MTRTGILLLLGLVVSGTLGGCNDDEDASACDIYMARLRDCGVLSAGKVSCQVDEEEDLSCELACVRNATCGELGENVCSEEESLPGNGFISCLASCTETFRCSNGETVFLDYRCDGDTDCSDGSDEQNCESLLKPCDGGLNTFSPADECDGYFDCEDEADEEGCAASLYFVCANGESVDIYSECDGYEDCGDGSDEASCEGRLFACDGEDRIPMDWVCDQEVDCEDGTDEAQGCAQYICD